MSTKVSVPVLTALDILPNARSSDGWSWPQRRSTSPVGAPVCGGRIRVEGSSSLYGHFVIEFELWKHDCTIDGDGKTTMTPSNHHQADDEFRQWVKDPT